MGLLCVGNAPGNEPCNKRIRLVALAAVVSCNVKLAWIHEMLHRHDPQAVLSLEQGLTLLFLHIIRHGRELLSPAVVQIIVV